MKAFWESLKYPYSGRLECDFPEKIPTYKPFDFGCSFYYDIGFRSNDVVIFTMEGVAEYKGNYIHIIARKKRLTCNSQFQISITQTDKDNWFGEYSSINPIDHGELKTFE